MKKDNAKFKTSKQNFIIALALLLATNVLMGIILMEISKRSLKEQINGRMLDVAKTAAAQMNGDEIKTVTANDKGTKEYERAAAILRSYHDNIDLDYIYGINDDGDGTFSFTIDPDREDPAEFGETIETTEALKTAAKGTPAVDKYTHSDEWGRFYSAYAPIFDSEKNVVGIIGVDFNADLLDQKMNFHINIAVIITMVALTIGIALAGVLMSKNRKNFENMLAKLELLNSETEKLDEIIMKNSIKKMDMLPNNKSGVLKALAAGETTDHKNVQNEYASLTSSVDHAYEKIKKYMRYISSEVYTDQTTGVNNKAAYRNKISELDKDISEGKGDFSVAFFDINGLKKIYTHDGFEAGEKLMFECANILKNVFGKDNVYHVTGDEFIVLADKVSRFQMEELFAAFDAEIDKYNDEHVKEHLLSVAKGTVSYDKEKHNSYRKIFIEAEANCKLDKEEYYKNKSSDNSIFGR